MQYLSLRMNKGNELFSLRSNLAITIRAKIVPESPALFLALRADVDFLGNPQSFGLIIRGNEFLAESAIRLNSLLHPPNRTVLESRFVRFGWHSFWKSGEIVAQNCVNAGRNEFRLESQDFRRLLMEADLCLGVVLSSGNTTLDRPRYLRSRAVKSRPRSTRNLARMRSSSIVDKLLGITIRTMIVACFVLPRLIMHSRNEKPYPLNLLRLFVAYDSPLDSGAGRL